MRIVGGARRGTALSAPKGGGTRPTSERLRETIFNILAHGVAAPVDGARVLDLFAGTGALGLEALSRGAAFALFVENAAGARAALRTNIEALGALGRSRVWRRDATKLGKCPVPPFSLVFCDPPYRRDLGVAALQSAASGDWLAPECLAVLEEHKDGAPETVPGWDLVDARAAGDSTITFLRRLPAGMV